METFKIKGEFIQLNQLIKAMGWVDNGAAANDLIDKGLMKVNGNAEFRKRNKLVPGDIVNYQGKQVIIK